MSNDNEFIRKQAGAPKIKTQDPLQRLAELRHFMRCMNCHDRLNQPGIPPRKIAGRQHHEKGQLKILIPDSLNPEAFINQEDKP